MDAMRFLPGPMPTAMEMYDIQRGLEERAYQELLHRRQLEAMQYMMAPPSIYDPVTGNITFLPQTPRPCCDICEATKGAHHSMSCAAPGVDPDTRVYLSELLGKVFRNGELEQAKKHAARAAVQADTSPDAVKEPLPIHRAMHRMLHADEQYENRVFLPGGHLVRDA